jgi:hypothetical protein
MASNDQLDEEIIKGLCGQQKGVSTANLLIILQTNFPDTEWDLETLEERLATGRKRGRYIGSSSSPTVAPTHWAINQKMLRLNSYNSRFEGFCSQIKTVNCCQYDRLNIAK